jgi:host factor-I protein
MPNRKLIRPNLTEMKTAPAARQAALRNRPVPPEQTNAEAFYYSKQMAARTSMVVVLNDGELLHGIIEWYDRDCVKLTRTEGPNLLVPKHSIKYMYKNGAPDDDVERIQPIDRSED